MGSGEGGPLLLIRGGGPLSNKRIYLVHGRCGALFVALDSRLVGVRRFAPALIT